MGIINQKHYEGFKKKLPRTKKLFEEAFLEKSFALKPLPKLKIKE